MDEVHRRLEDAVKRRDKLASEVQRMKGRLESAEQSLETVERECRDRKIEPDQLDKAIESLSDRYTQAVSDIENEITTAETALQPYLQDTTQGDPE